MTTQPSEHGPGRGKFVWPPVRVRTPGDPAASDAPGAAVSPPRAPDASLTMSPSVRPRPHWWHEVERVWLAPVAPPLMVRIAEAGWSPDPPGAYCERCGTTLGTGEAGAKSAGGSAEASTPLDDDEFACAACRGVVLPWERFVRLGAYEGCLAEWVQETKFSRCHWLGESLGAELARAIHSSGALGPSTRAGGGAVVIVPVGTSFWRRLSRGIDHAGCIARGVARVLGATVVHGLRREHRPTQRGLSPTARERNVKGAFRAVGPGNVLRRARAIILVDDVRTTGATLREAARTLRRALREAGRTQPRPKPVEIPEPRLVVAVVAVTPDSARRPALDETAVWEGTAQDRPSPPPPADEGVRVR